MKKVSLIKSLKFRTPLVFLSVIIPLVSLANFYITRILSNKIINEAKENLVLHSNLLADNIQEWNQINVLALLNLSNQIDITQGNSNKQKTVLAEIVNTYNHFYLAHIINLKGWDIARSDDKPLKYYGDRHYFTQAIAGNKINYQTIISRTTKQPALCLATPIFRLNKIEGVTSICTKLQTLTKQVGQLKFGKTGYAFLVDQNATLLAHPEPQVFSENKLISLREYPPVQNLLQGNNQYLSFTDQDNIKWVSYSIPLDNNWILVVQQQEAEFLAHKRQFQNLAFVITVTVILIMSGLTFGIAHYLIKPINNLTNRTNAVERDEFEKTIMINSPDELRLLPNSWNQREGDREDMGERNSLWKLNNK